MKTYPKYFTAWERKAEKEYVKRELEKFDDETEVWRDGAGGILVGNLADINPEDYEDDLIEAGTVSDYRA